MSGDTAREFAEEYTNANDTAWRASLREQTYKTVAPDPSSLNGFYAADQTVQPMDINEASDQKFHVMAQQRKNEFVTAYEQAIAQTAEDLPMSFWMQWHPAELKAWGAVDDDGFAQLEQVQANMAEQRQIEARIEERFQLEEEAIRNRTNFFSGWGQLYASATGGREAHDKRASEKLGSELQGLRDRIANEEFGIADADYADEIDAFMASSRELYDRMRDGYRDPAEIRKELLNDGLNARLQKGDREQLLDKFTLEDGTELSMGDYENFWRDEADLLDQFKIAPIGEMTDTEYEDFLMQREAILRQTVRNAPQDYEAILTPGQGIGFWSGVGNGVGEVFDKGMRAGGWLIDHGGVVTAPVKYITIPLLEAMLGSEEEAMQDQVTQLMAETGEPDRDRLAMLSQDSAQLAWSELQEEAPDMYEEYVQIAGLDLSLAFSIFQSDLLDTLDPEQQTQYLRDADEENNDMMEQLKDTDFSTGSQLLHLMGAYNRLIPMRLATYSTLLLTDTDILNRDAEGEWGKLLGAVEDKAKVYDYTPSKTLDMDGSLAGLLLDLGAGIAFDPITWLTAPAGIMRGGAAATRAGAQSQARSAVTRQFIKDSFNFARSPSRGGGAMWRSLDWLDPVSRREFLAQAGYNRQILPKAPWRKAGNATEAQRSFLDDLVEGVDDVMSDSQRATLHDDIMTNGFEEAVEVSVSRADGNYWISDGVKRVQATGDDVSHIPVKLRVTDEITPSTGVKIPGYVDDSAKKLDELSKGVFRNADDVPIKPNAASNPELAATLVARGGKLQEQGQLVTVGTQKLKDGTTVTIRQTKETWRKHAAGVSDNNANFGEYYAIAEDGTVVGGIEAGGFASGFGVAEGQTGKGLFTAMLDGAHDAGDDLWMRMRFDELSEEGAAAVQRYASNKMQDALPVGNRLGKHLDDVMDGEPLAIPFKEAGGNVDEFMRPDKLFPMKVMDNAIDEGFLNELVERALLRGATPNAGQYSVIAQRSGAAFTKMLRSNKVGEWLERYTGQFNNIKSGALTGPQAVDDIVRDIMQVYGANASDMNIHLEKIIEWEVRQSVKSQKAAEKAATLNLRNERLRHLQDSVADLWDDASKGAIRRGLGENAEQALKNQNAMREIIAAEDKAIRKGWKALDDETSVIGATDELEEMVQEAFNDFNRKHIATQPGWAKLVDPETGMVPWEKLRKGAPKEAGKPIQGTERALTEDMISVADDMGVDAEGLMQTLSNSQNMKLSYELPLSPLEMILASSTSGAAYTKATHIAAVSALREGAFTVDRLWKLDKVFSVATAGTVSMDELMRIFGRYGNRSVARWIGDRGNNLQARVAAVAHGRKPFVSKGAEFLSPQKQERMRALNDYGARLKGLERNSLEQHGLGWQDFKPGQQGYEDAARRWSGGMLQDSGFRSFLGGRESFRKWFTSPDGERLRKSTVIKVEDGQTFSTMLDDADAFYDGWEQLFDQVILKKARDAGKYDIVRKAWDDAARMIDEGGGVARDLPDVAINYMSGVRGVKNLTGNKMSPAALTETFFDKLFMDPINYRRGFLAELTRTQEKSRLMSLMRDQGKRIVSDAELESILNIQGFAGGARVGLRPAIHEMAIKAGYMPESYLDELVESAVRREIDHTLYKFDSGSRMGSQARAAFPFGKPWADMAAYWGREIVRKPVMRGWINNKNFLGLKSAAEAGILPMNRSSAMISRLANTDFTIDRGLIGGQGEGILHEGGLIPGSEKSDFSPLFFLPTEGENPFQYMIPGLGVIPIAFLDTVMALKYDPVHEPEEYQNLQDEIGKFIPAVHFQQGGFLSRLAGGGTAGKAINIGADLTGMFGSASFFNMTSMLGDISREIDRTRHISAMLADPAELELLLSAKTPEEAEDLLNALAVEADKRASASHLAETASRWMVPIANQFDSGLAEIENVWLDAAGFEELEHLLPGDPENMTDEERRQYASDIRTEFFRLDGWERDALVVQQPSLAVNMVGSWEWSPQAQSLDVEGSDYAYRTGSTKRELARHEALVRQNLIRPVQPLVRARRILGVIDAAKRSSAKELYTSQVDRVNDILWEHVVVNDEGVAATIDMILNSEFGKTLDLRTPAEVWHNWSRIEEDFEVYAANALGIDPTRGVSTRKADLTAFDDLRAAIKIPENLKPWGTTFPGLDEENVSARFNDWEILGMTQKDQKISEALGITIEPGMTGKELFHEVQQIIAQRESPIYDVARPDYDRYIAERGTRSGRNMMYEAAQSDLVAPELQEKIHEYMFKHDLLMDRRDVDRRHAIGLADMQRMKDEFLYIQHGSKDQKTDWPGIWKEQYERFYGPLDWIPPEPKSPFNEAGEVTGSAMTPSIRHIVDGDTILIQTSLGSPQVNSVRLLGLQTEEVGGPMGELALEQENELKDAILQAVSNGDSIYLVTDERFGLTDHYGRMLAWLWIGDTPYYNPDHLLPTQAPSGGN